MRSFSLFWCILLLACTPAFAQERNPLAAFVEALSAQVLEDSRVTTSLSVPMLGCLPDARPGYRPRYGIPLPTLHVDLEGLRLSPAEVQAFGGAIAPQAIAQPRIGTVGAPEHRRYRAGLVVGFPEGIAASFQYRFRSPVPLSIGGSAGSWGAAVTVSADVVVHMVQVGPADFILHLAFTNLIFTGAMSDLVQGLVGNTITVDFRGQYAAMGSVRAGVDLELSRWFRLRGTAGVFTQMGEIVTGDESRGILRISGLWGLSAELGAFVQWR